MHSGVVHVSKVGGCDGCGGVAQTRIMISDVIVAGFVKEGNDRDSELELASRLQLAYLMWSMML